MGKRHRKKRSAAGTVLKVLLILLFLLVAAVSGLFIYLRHLYAQTDYRQDEAVTLDANYQQHIREEASENGEGSEPETLGQEAEDALRQLLFDVPTQTGVVVIPTESVPPSTTPVPQITQSGEEAMTGPAQTESAPVSIQNDETAANGSGDVNRGLSDTTKQTEQEIQKPLVSAEDNTYNLLLIGSRRLTDTWYGNADYTILVTINENTQAGYATAFDANMVAYASNIGVRKIKTIHAAGGGPLLVKSLEDTYGLHIDNYVMADYDSLSAIVDLTEGVPVVLTEEEAEKTNVYIRRICRLKDLKEEEYLLSSGETRMNGLQTAAYCRVSTEEKSYEERLEETVSSLMHMAAKMKVTELAAKAGLVLSNVTHNITPSTLQELIMKLSSWVRYELELSVLPYNDHCNMYDTFLIPEMPYTADTLKSRIYSR